MKPANIKSGYTDNLARQRRARILLKLGLISIILIVSFAGVIYLLFFSKVLDVRSVTLNGLAQVDSTELQNKINDRLSQKIFRLIPRKNNIALISSYNFENEILDIYPVLKSLKISRNWPHELIFDFVERTALGVWCFKQDCAYFDIDGNTWGQAAKSSGFLITTIEDNRDINSNKIDKEYLEALKIFLTKESPILIRNVVIDKNSFRDFKILTDKNYFLLFSIDSNIKKQLEMLEIFLNEKGVNFKPQYIDLRIDGRIYYK